MKGAERRLATTALTVLLTVLLWGGAIAQSPLTQKGQVPHPTSTVHSDCLGACHQTHGTKVAGGLLLRAKTETACLACHSTLAPASASVGIPQIERFAGAGSSHLGDRPKVRGIEYRRVVRAGAGPGHIVMQQDCSGCHNPHGKGRGKLRAAAFDTQGQLVGDKPAFVAQVCFGCHAGAEATATSQTDSDLGLLFSKGARSSHFIGASAADRVDLPSLRLTTFQGKLDCTSCHDNPDRNGPRGPHSSPYPSLLKGDYGTERDAGRIGERSNELCYLCHDKKSITSNQSFPLHAEHLTGFTNGKPPGARRDTMATLQERNPMQGIRTPRDLGPGRSAPRFQGFGQPTPCSTCHDPHGSIKQPGLIRFDRSVVGPSSVGGVEFRKMGLGHGNCTLTCHGHDHVQTLY